MPSHQRARLGIGYMPEDRRHHPRAHRGGERPPAGLGLGAPDAAERLARIYRLIPEVAAFKERKGLQLSGGQQKLAALARAFMSGTRLLLLDEPFEGVAPVLAQRLVEVVGQLRSEGLAVLLSESDLSHSRKLLDVVYQIDRGQVAGPPAARPDQGAPE